MSANCPELEELYEEERQLSERLGKRLSGVAIALKGPEPPLTRWSYHDLPELAAAARQRIETLEQALAIARKLNRFAVAGGIKLPHQLRVHFDDNGTPATHIICEAHGEDAQGHPCYVDLRDGSHSIQ